MKYIFLLFVFLKAGYCGFLNTRFQTENPFSKAESETLSLSVRALSFVENDEFFFVTDGLTYIGSSVSGCVRWEDQRYFIEGGSYLLYYSGTEKPAKVLPFFRFQWNLKPSLRLIFGNIYGTVYHRLPLPLYAFENFLINPNETGVQFLLKKQNVSFDLWLNWESFISPGSLNREKFSAGFSSGYKYKNGNFFLKIPLYLVAAHKGGQIHYEDKPLESLLNAGGGAEAGYYVKSELIKRFSLACDLYYYYDFSYTKTQVFDEGYAFYPRMQMKASFFYVQAGYWFLDNFYGPRGDLNYGRIDYRHKSLSEKVPLRRTWIFKLMFFKNITKDVRFLVKGELFIDPAMTHVHPDYSYGMFFHFDRNFLLKKKHRTLPENQEKDLKVK